MAPINAALTISPETPLIERIEEDVAREHKPSFSDRGTRSVAGFFREPRHSAEDKQRDFRYIYSRTDRHKRVGKLVRYNRNKEQKRSYQTCGPVKLRALVGINSRKVSRRKTPEHKRENYEPGVIQPDLNASYAEEKDAALLFRNRVSHSNLFGLCLIVRWARRIPPNFIS